MYLLDKEETENVPIPNTIYRWTPMSMQICTSVPITGDKRLFHTTVHEISSCYYLILIFNEVSYHLVHCVKFSIKV